MSLKKYVGRGLILAGLGTLALLNPGCSCIENNNYGGSGAPYNQQGPAPSHSQQRSAPSYNQQESSTWRDMGFKSEAQYEYYKETNIGEERALQPGHEQRKTNIDSKRQGPHRQLRQ